MSNKIKPIELVNGLRQIEAARHQRDGWDSHRDYLFGLVYERDSSTHGFGQIPRPTELDANTYLWTLAELLPNNPDTAKSIAQLVAKILGIVVVREGWVKIPENDEDISQIRMDETDAADHPRGREIREAYMVDIWGRAYALLRLRAGNGDPEELALVPAETHAEIGIICVLARILREIMPHLRVPTGDLAAVDDLIERLSERQEVEEAEAALMERVKNAQ